MFEQHGNLFDGHEEDLLRLLLGLLSLGEPIDANPQRRIDASQYAVVRFTCSNYFYNLPILSFAPQVWSYSITQSRLSTASCVRKFSSTLSATRQVHQMPLSALHSVLSPHSLSTDSILIGNQYPTDLSLWKHISFTHSSHQTPFERTFNHRPCVVGNRYLIYS
jgi:hypothetical protein